MEHIHLSAGFDDTRTARLKEAFPNIGVTSGKDVPEETTILAAGQLPDGSLDLAGLRAVIVPFAGIPPKTLECVRERPHLKLYNLHHNDMATSELAIGLLLACCRQITVSDRLMRQGIWRGRTETSSSYLLAGKRALIYGYGAIGKQIGKVLEALGMEIVGVGRSQEDWRRELPRCEVLMVAAPLTDETRGAIGTAEIMALREPRLIVNIARGPIIDETALYEACKSGAVAGAGIDVWYRYPDGDAPVQPSEYPFNKLDNVVMSPHTGGAGDTSEDLRIAALIDLLHGIIEGPEPKGVNLNLGY